MITPEAIQEALQVLKSPDTTKDQKLESAFNLVVNNCYDFFDSVLEALLPLKDDFNASPTWNYCLGFAYCTDQEPAKSIEHMSKALAYNPQNTMVYTILTWSYLQLEDYQNAFLVSSAGLHNCEDKGQFEVLRVVAARNLQNNPVESFEKDGITYSFRLFTSNTQEIEAANFHLTHNFTEEKELAMIRQHIGSADAIAEIGCLVGNHSVFFLKNLKPSRMTLIDASQTSLDHTRANLEFNQPSESPVPLNFILAAVGRESGTIEFFNTPVQIAPLDTLLSEAFDFIKIDVDGFEIDALEGARQYIEQHQPRIMIEVMHSLKDPFNAFLESVAYTVIADVSHQNYSNYIIAPKPQA